MPAIDEAIKAAGSQAALAERLGVTQQAISAWVVQGFAPRSRLLDIERETGVPARDLLLDQVATLACEK